jgi:hypothetical protein
MDKELDILENIEQYLRGSMTATERLDFEREMAADATLREEVEAYRRIFDGFQAARSEQFSQKLLQWDAEPAQPSAAKVVSIRRFLRPLAAAAALLLMVGIGLRWYAVRHYSNEAIVESMYAAPNFSGLMGDAAQATESSFMTFVKSGNRDVTNGLYGAALLKFDHALDILPEAGFDEFTQKYWRDNLSWSMALSRLAKGDPQWELEVQRIANDNSHEYRQKALELQNRTRGGVMRRLAK